MQLLSYARSTSLQNFAIALLTFSAMAIFAMVAAYWTWEWLAPPLSGPAPMTQNEARRAVADPGIFGMTVQDADSRDSAGSGSRIQLLGLLTASAHARSHAVLRIEPGPSIAVQEGDEIAPGIRLAEIATDHVVVERGGRRETLSWPSKK